MFLIIGLSLGVRVYGLLLGVIVVALADVFRYMPILVGQKGSASRLPCKIFSLRLQCSCSRLLGMVALGFGVWDFICILAVVGQQINW